LKPVSIPVTVALLALVTACTVVQAPIASPPAAPASAPSSAVQPVPAGAQPAPATPAKRTPVKFENIDWQSPDETELGFDVRDVDLEGGLDEDSDGDNDYHMSADVAFGSEAAHQIEFHEDDRPIMSEEPDVVTLTDKASGQSQRFSASQDFDTFAVGEGDGALTVTLNPDNTFTVDGQTLTTPEAVAAHVKDHPTLKNVSIESVAFLHGFLERRVSEPTRGEAGTFGNYGEDAHRHYKTQIGGPTGYRSLLQAVPSAKPSPITQVVKAFLKLRKQG
jgi:hypothetical protein